MNKTLLQFFFTSFFISVYPVKAQLDKSQRFFAHAKAGDLEGIEEDIEEGININMQNALGQTAFYLAHSNGHIALAKYLLLQGADPTIYVPQGQNGVVAPKGRMQKMVEEARRYREREQRRSSEPGQLHIHFFP